MEDTKALAKKAAQEIQDTKDRIKNQFIEIETIKDITITILSCNK